MQAIVDACKTGELKSDPVLVISNNANSETLRRAKKEKIESICINSKTNPTDEDEAIREVLKKHNVDLVILAGYMKKVGPKTLKYFKNKILNIHPALLPKHGGEGMYGLRVHQAVIKSGDKESGATVHLVDGLYDHGKILNQISIKLTENETPESLQKRVLALELHLYKETIKKIIEGKIELNR